VSGEPDQIADIDALCGQLGVALQFGQADEEGGPCDLRARLAQQLDRGQRRAARGDQVVD
jgi:hypothetical protein